MSGEASASTGEVSQHNTGGINVANTGIIHTVVVHAGIQPSGTPLWMAPPPPGPVVPRPGLVAALRGALLSDVDGPVAVTTALEGAGGFGKTTLVADLCLTDPSVRARFTGGLLWVTLGQNAAGADLAAKVNGVCGLLSGQEFTSPDPQQAGFRLGALLSRRPDTLLVIDDVWHAAQLAPFLIGAPRCRRIITTRNATVLPRYVSSIRVDAMEIDEAVQALTQGLPGLPRPTIDQLVELTGRWPVLLSLVNAAMAESVRQGATVAQAGTWVLDRLLAGGPAALDVSDASSRDQAVEATLQASLDLMAPEDQARYFDLAIFPEDIAVPGSVLALLWSGTGGRLSPAAADRLRSRLSSLCLASGAWEDGPALRLHDVLRSYLRHRQGAAWLAERNRTLIDAVRSTIVPSSGTPEDGGTAWWRLPDDAGYLWRNVTYHLAEADAGTELTDLVCDPRWLLARIERHGPVAVGGDLALSDAPTAEELHRVVGQQAHLLGRLRPGLADTLLSRIPVTDRTERFHSRAARVLTGPRLTPFWPLPDLPDPDLDRTLEGHTSAVRACAASPDGRWLASAGFDRSLRIWNVATGATRQVLDGHTGWIWGCAWTPDGASIASAGDDGSVRVWDVRSGICRTVSTGHEGAVMSCAVAPDGTWLASTGVDGTIRVWDVRSGICRTVLTGHEGAVMSCAVAPDGTWLASTGVDGTIRVWDMRSGICRTVLTGHEGAVMSCAVAPDGTWLASTGVDGTIRVWDVRSGTERVSLAGHEGWVNACAVAADGTMLVSAGTDRTVRVWDVATGQLGLTLYGDTGGANACAMAHDASWIAAGGSDGTVHVWRPRWGEPDRGGISGAAAVRTQVRAPVEPVRQCAVFPGGGRIVSSGDDGVVRLWDVATGTELAARNARTGGVACCAVSPDGSWFASSGAASGYDSTLHLWRPDGHAPHITLTGHTAWVERCAFTPDGTQVATVSSDGTLRLWDTTDGRPLAVLGTNLGQLFGCAISPDGAKLASCGTDRLVRLWDIASRALVAVLPGHTNRVTNCTFSADGSWLASAAYDGTVRTWDTATGAPLLTLASGDGATWDCAVSPDDALIASTSTDGVIRIWDAVTGRCRNALRVEQEMRSCAWISDTRLCASGYAGVYVLDYTAGG
ncbi:NB-ARC domain-containing protein [Streptomyces sp. NPDC051555]|uniref:NB-ARC domain-containing protein n=1 Tax=Streptomyces sp. NPDC051555 TaxID=3365657 RepID=UPI00378DC028